MICGDALHNTVQVQLCGLSPVAAVWPLLTDVYKDQLV